MIPSRFARSDRKTDSNSLPTKRNRIPPPIPSGPPSIGRMLRALCLLLLCIPLIAAAQESTAIIQGTLQNAAGAPVPDAIVHLSDASHDLTAVSGSEGMFQFVGLAAGQYQLKVDAGGRVLEFVRPVKVSAGPQSLLLTITDQGLMLSAGPQEQPGSEKLTSEKVNELPLNKRDFSALLLMAAGTMTDANGATNFTAQFAINGQRGVEAVFAMDGADISDPEMGGSTFSNFNVDAVQEIQSSSGWMPAQIGQGAAGFTNIISRSGSSGFHGSFFEFLRNSALDARNYFDHATPETPGRIPPFQRNEFGFTNGGPVVLPHIYDGRGKTFYFGQYQGFRQVLGTTQVFPVPTELEREGYDATAYPGDVLLVPVDPSIAAILARYPLPNLPTGSYGIHTYAASSKVDTDADQFSIRLDHKLSDKNQFFGRFNFNNLTGPTTNPDQTAIERQFGVTYVDHQRNLALNV